MQRRAVLGDRVEDFRIDEEVADCEESRGD